MTDENYASLIASLSQAPADFQLDAQPEQQAAAAAKLSPTAFKLDDWSMRRGKNWAETEAAKLLDPAGDNRDMIASDMLAAAWEPKPQLQDAATCEDARRHHFLSSMMQTPDYQKLHRATRLDDVASELAAASFAKQFFSLIEQPEPDDDLDRDSQALQAAAKAVADAGGEVETLVEARNALAGDQDGDGSAMSVANVKAIFDQIRNNGMLRRVMELSGRYRRLAKSIQAAKPVHGNDEMVGVTFDNDLSRVLPVELAIIDDEDLEYEFLRRYAENSLIVREMRSCEAEAAGPIVIIVDESGSMDGEPIAHAKAMALSILWVAQHQNRWACLVGFAHQDDGNFLVVPPGKRDQDALLAWLTHFYDGGTRCTVPLETVPRRWQELGCPAGKTDIITITDTCLSVPMGTQARFNAWKQANNVRMNTIVIGEEPGDFARVSDQVFKIEELNLEAQGVSECLSV